MKRFSIILILIIVCLSSCTVQKRSFRKGYHVEWNRKFRPATSEPEEKDNFRSKYTEEENTIESVVSTESADSFIETNDADENKAEPKEPDRFATGDFQTTLKTAGNYPAPPDTTRKEHQAPEPVQPERKIVEPLSWVSLGTSLIYSVLVTLVVQQVISLLFITLCVALFILTFVLAIKSCNRYRHNKARYRKPHIAALSMAIAGGTTVIILLALFLVWLGKVIDAALTDFFNQFK